MTMVPNYTGRSLVSLFFFLNFSAITTNAFSALHRRVVPRLASGTYLAYSVHDEDRPIQCFLIQQKSKDENDEGNYNSVQVICTSNPDEYAWFNGIEPEQMVPTDGIYDEAVQCVEGASPRGVPEWECESAFQ
mmetsp:Transcript_24129/g.42823  ORF Transcript_24129/g.42823 Transcript_24129/m.42823 type:complete len:133 (-) Transcript_24129:2817-3215(-)